jgi:hypothetical protein
MSERCKPDIRTTCPKYPTFDAKFGSQCSFETGKVLEDAQNIPEPDNGT